MMREMVRQSGSYMTPNIILKTNNSITKNCRICDKSILHKNQYYYISPIAEIKLTICRNCAVREYYGTSGKMNKKYRKHMINETLFGLKDNV